MNRNSDWAPRIGEVYVADFHGEGSVQKKRRPCLIFQNNTGNLHSPNVVVLPLTSVKKKRRQPTHVFLPRSTGLRMDSIVLCENPVCMPKANLGEFITRLPAEDMKRVTVGSLLANSALSFLDLQSLLKLWRDASGLNSCGTEH